MQRTVQKWITCDVMDVVIVGSGVGSIKDGISQHLLQRITMGGGRGHLEFIIFEAGVYLPSRVAKLSELT